MTSSLYATIAIVGCLLDREKTGKGQRIDISLLDTAVSAMNYYVVHHSLTGRLPSRLGSGASAWVPYQAFDTKDSSIWIGVSTDKFWNAFCEALGLDELGADLRYATGELRRQNRAELVMKVGEICRQYDSAELESKLAAAGVPCGRLLNVDEVSQDPQIKFRQIIEEWDYAGRGKIKTVRTPIMIGGELPETRMQTPHLGEHTVEVLRELEYSEEEIGHLIDSGIAVQHEPQA